MGKQECEKTDSSGTENQTEREQVERQSAAIQKGLKRLGKKKRVIA